MGFILDNYSYRDPLATIARFGVAVSVIFAYPLLFHGGRDGLLALWRTLQTSRRSRSSSSSGINDTVATTTTATATQQWESEIVTVLLLSIVTTLAIWVNDLTFVLSF